MTDEERVAEALWRNNFPNDNRGEYPYPQLIDPTKDDLRVMARAAIAAMGPQLTAEEAATLADFLKEKHPRVLFGTAAEAYIAKLSLIAKDQSSDTD